MNHASRSRAQSSPIGVILILGLTLTAAVGIVVVGGDAIQGTQDTAEIGQAEQAMTQFDARAAQVALGDSGSQTIPLGGQSGSYSVKPDVGRVRLLHEDWNGTECGNCDDDYGHLSTTSADGNTTILYNQTLGAVVYESGGTKVAYQGGGVWRKSEDGAARPVSSPEFHYRDATLTFPLVRVEGSGGGSGQVKANVQRVETAKYIYPNQSRTYPDGDTGLLNPVQNGNMTVEITSEYCEGWRGYFMERTEGDVSECNDGTVTADIVTLGVQGDFDPTNGNEIPMRGQDDGHTLEDLNFNFTTSTSESDFNNFQWSMAAEDGDRQFEIVLRKKGGGNNNCDEPVETFVYYSEDGGDNYHYWKLDGSNGEDPFRIRCTGGEEVINFNLLNDSREFAYTDMGSNSELREFKDDADSFKEPAEFTEHQPDHSDVSYSTGDKESVEFVIQHYFALMGDVDLIFDEKANGNPANLGDDSSGEIRYEGGGNVVTYLHVTENRVEVELSG